MSNKFYIKSLEKIKKGKLAEAILFLDKAIEEEPTNAIYYSERGVCFLNTEQYGRALGDMNTSVKLDPDYSYRYASRGFVKDRMGDTKGGIADYEIAVKLDPEDSIAYNNLGLLQEKLGYQKSSKRNFAIADELADENPDSLPNIEDAKENKPINEKNSFPPITPNALETKKTIGSIIKNVLTDKKTRLEFVQFIKNGFKIK
jgi:tetratricopeptide (TPR) repeat protein